MKNQPIISIVPFFSLIILSAPSFAAVPDISGVYSGDVTITSACLPGGSIADKSNSLRVEQTGSNFTSTITNSLLLNGTVFSGSILDSGTTATASGGYEFLAPNGGSVMGSFSGAFASETPSSLQSTDGTYITPAGKSCQFSLASTNLKKVAPICVSPQVLDPTTNTCVTPIKTCPTPQVLDPTTNECITPHYPDHAETAKANLIQTELPKNIQIIRTTNNLVSQHLEREIAEGFYIGRSPYRPYRPDDKDGIRPYHPNENKDGASSDVGNSLSDSFWGSTSISDISQDNSRTNKFDNQIYQFVGGFDKRLGDFFVGSALTYAYSTKNQTGQDSSSHVVGITPYAAYQINNFMFVSALAGYNFTHISDNLSSANIDLHDYLLEANLNLYKVFYDALIVKGRFGSRFHHTFTSSLSQAFDPSTDEFVWLGDVELGYRFDNGLIPYIGSSYEHYNRENSFQGARINQGIFFMRGGFDYPVYTNLTVGAKIQADLNDNYNDLISGVLSFRLAF